ncbi:MAG: type II toxin-antitoxin system VapC family toxin [Dermatophilaceae bacterium]|jgi:ribonuclease VapC|nr:type II toxin-antitoxin system VapC family toxin [Actinomycetales bacterium]MBP8881838.1 type II toxin-antitoxin system VapC family toxin [Dermatophilaceae bacterium]MBP9918236.1 type II toxin-antitoxin system VapC family toxin [Dermatophilaceae bacterium]
MIIDSSAIMAIVRNEPERQAFITAIADASRRLLAAPNLLEAAIVVERLGDPTLVREFDTVLADLQVESVPFTAAHAQIARDAYRDFGKGSGHPAQLNFGDCFAYALAKDADEPLLYKGNDFVHTDIRSAV